MRAGSIQVRLLGILGIGISCSIIACSGNGGGASSPESSPAPAIQLGVTTPEPTTTAMSISLAPGGSSALAAGGSLVFKATLTGTAPTDLTWAVDLIPNGNSIVGAVSVSGSSATYKAPTVIGSHLITVTSISNPAVSAWATVTVQDVCPPLPAGPSNVSVTDSNFGAKGDGVTDDTAAIQKAINLVAGTGGTVNIPAGTFMITTNGSGSRGLIMKSQMTLKMANGAVLKAIPNASSNYTILSVLNAYNVNITGGTLLGDRATHTGTSGEYGMGLQITGSQQVVVSNLNAKECWGDGFYIATSSNITLCSIIADHNRRNGLSVTDCDGLMVRNSIFMNTQGTEPEDGFDIEPNPGQKVNNVQINGCIFYNNSGNGLEDGVPDSNKGVAFITNVVMDGNAVANNGATPADGAVKNGIRLSGAAGHSITNNIVVGNTGRGIYIRENADNALVSNNIVMKTKGDGIVQDWNNGVMIMGNSVINNTGNGIKSINAVGGTVSGNIVSGNGATP